MRRPVLALLALLLVAASCSSDDEDPSGAAPDPVTTAPGSASPFPPAEAGELVEVPCWWDLPADAPQGVTVTCSTLDVPSDPDDPASDPVTLAVARLHGSGDPDLEPVLYLHGGPGGAALDVAPVGLMALPILDERDLVTFDQRGSGRSTPSLNCPEKEQAILDTIGAAEDWEVEYAQNVDAVAACRARLVEEGIDLDLYDTPTSVQDIEVLRETMGVELWNLWGGSYGTRLGLDYARTHPDRVRSLLLDSVYSTQAGGVERDTALAQDALDRLVAACAEDDGCSAAYGDLGALLDEATAAMDADPEELTATVTVGGEQVERDFVLTGADLRGGLFAALYDSELIPLLPSVIAAVASGDRSIVPQFVDVGVPRLLDLSEGAFYSVDCADSGRLIEGPEAQAALEEVDRDALIALNAAQVFCAGWDVEAVPASFNEPATPALPTLVFGGTLDPITPFAESEEQAEATPGARLVAVPNGGHGVASYDDCTKEARDAFWRDPSATLPDCVEQVEAAPFVVGG